MKKNLSTRGAAALLALSMGYMGQGVAQAAHIEPKSAQPVEDDQLKISCLDAISYEYRRSYYGQPQSLMWASCVGVITQIQSLALSNTWKNMTMLAPEKVLPISRGRLLEYLYHLAGSPEVKNLPEKSPYTDLTPGDVRYKVAIWATRVGLSAGWSDGSFHYDTPASRGAYFTFLYRAAGSPKVTLESLDAANAVRAEKGAAPIKEGSELHRAMSWIKQHALKGEQEDGLYISHEFRVENFYDTPDYYYIPYWSIFDPLMVLDNHEELAPIVARLQSLS